MRTAARAVRSSSGANAHVKLRGLEMQRIAKAKPAEISLRKFSVAALPPS